MMISRRNHHYRSLVSLRSLLTAFSIVFALLAFLTWCSSDYVHNAGGLGDMRTFHGITDKSLRAEMKRESWNLRMRTESHSGRQYQRLSASASAVRPQSLVVRDAEAEAVADDDRGRFPPPARFEPARFQAQNARFYKPQKKKSNVAESLYNQAQQLPRGDDFKAQEENSIKQTRLEPVSTFSVDVDTASYAYARRLLKQGIMPPPESIKVEEFINYFDYSIPQAMNKSVPFEPSVLVSDSPWNKGRKLMHIGIKGYDVPPEDPTKRPFCNIVFLVDVSGSMYTEDKLPLAKTAMEALVKSMLRPDDLVSVVTYASNVRVALPPTPAGRDERILSSIRSLTAGGSTFGAGGIEKAYELAEENFDKDAVNRIILVTDGDFNVGLSDSGGLQKLVEDKRDSGIFLSVLGFGMGNYKDTTMKALANHGNGVAAYIDTVEEASKVMVTEASSTVFPIAKDVKIQVEFNPSMVSEYRLVGYEKRLLRNEDFNNDKVDAGDIGSGHTVTAIYEFTPADSEEGRAMDPLRYAPDTQPRRLPSEMPSSAPWSQEYAYLKMRYKLPKESVSHLISRPITKQDHEEALLAKATTFEHFRSPLTIKEFKFATAVAGFAQLLKGGRYTNEFSYDDILAMAAESTQHDPHGYRKQFFELVGMAKRVQTAHADE